MVYGDALKPERLSASHIRVYGKNGTMGALEPVKEIRAHELCLVFEATAPDAGDREHDRRHRRATRRCTCRYPSGAASSPRSRCPYNALDRGAVYRFNVNHVVEPDDPYEMFPMELVEVGGATAKEVAA